MILGNAGTGKTTFARELSRRASIPVISLDDRWRPTWSSAELEAFREWVQAQHQGEAWISDGNFAAATFDLRLPRATVVLWIEAPIKLCRVRVIRRLFRAGESHGWRNLGRVQRFIGSFDRVNRPRIEALLLEHAPHLAVRHLSGPRETEEFLRCWDEFGRG